MPPVNKRNTCYLAGEEESSKAKGKNPTENSGKPYGWEHSHPSGKVSQSPTFSKIF